MERNKKINQGFIPIGIIIAIVVLVGLAGGGWYAEQKGYSHILKNIGITLPGNNSTSTKDFEKNAEKAVINTSGWQTYRNDQYGFEFKYPADWLAEGEYIDKYENGILVTSAAFGIGPKGGPFITISHTFIDYDNTSKEAQLEKINCTKKETGCDSLSNDFGVAFVKKHYNDDQHGQYDLLAYVPTGKSILGFYEELIQDNPKNVEIEKTFNQILSTFKFITPSAPTTAKGTLAGKISIGPICPVETIPPNPSCTPTPETYASRKFLVLSSDQSKTITSFRADNSGNYSVSLPSGTYMVVSAKTGIGYISKDLPNTVTIQSGQIITLDIHVDTGIR